MDRIPEMQKQLGLFQHYGSSLEGQVPQIDQDTPLKEMVEPQFHSSLPDYFPQRQPHCRRSSLKLPGVAELGDIYVKFCDSNDLRVDVDRM